MKQTYFLLFAALTALAPKTTLRAKPSDHHQSIVAVVSTTRDSGAGSLRAAIESANRNAGTRIVFRISATENRVAPVAPASGVWVLVPLSPLPPLLKPDTHIEGKGQVALLGDKASASWSGLRVTASRCKIVGLKWSNWPGEAISIRASRTVVENNRFEKMPSGIVVRDKKSRVNRFEQNLFGGTKTPIALRDGSNDGIAAPTLTITRDDAIAPVSHKFTLKFKGKAKSNVSLELDYAADEAREEPRIDSIRETRTVKTDAQGNAEWQFDRKGYPVGSWTATATQNGSTSAFSNVVVLPYLR